MLSRPVLGRKLLSGSGDVLVFKDHGAEFKEGVATEHGGCGHCSDQDTSAMKAEALAAELQLPRQLAARTRSAGESQADLESIELAPCYITKPWQWR